MGVLGKVVGRAVHTVSQVVLARSLGPASYGLYAIGWTLLRLGALLAPLGLDRAVVRFGSRMDGARSELKGVVLDALSMATVSSVTVALCALAFAPLIAQQVFHEPQLVPLLRWFALALVLASVLRVLVAITWTSRRVRYGVIAEDLGQPLVNLLMISVSVCAGWGLVGAVQAAVWSFAIPTVLAGFFVVGLFGWLPDAGVSTRHDPVKLLKFSLPAMLAASLPVFLTWTDRMMVGALRPTGEMGVYQAVSQLPIVFSLVLSGIGGTVFGPMVADLHTRGETARLRRLFLVTTKWGIYASTPIFLILILLPKELITVLYGVEYVQGWRPLAILATAGFVNAASGPVGLVLIMISRERLWLAISVSALALDLVLQFHLTPRLGLIGAACSTLITLIYIFGTGLVVAGRLGYWPYDSRFWKGAVAALGALIAGLTTRVLLPAGVPIASVLVGGLAICSVFVGLLSLLRLDEEDYEFTSVIAAQITRLSGHKESP